MSDTFFKHVFFNSVSANPNMTISGVTCFIWSKGKHC